LTALDWNRGAQISRRSTVRLTVLRVGVRAGLGEKKRAEFGAVFAAEIAEYLKTNSRMAFE
jgi:hypothetical protein